MVEILRSETRVAAFSFSDLDHLDTLINILIAGKNYSSNGHGYPIEISKLIPSKTSERSGDMELQIVRPGHIEYPHFHKGHSELILAFGRIEVDYRLVGTREINKIEIPKRGGIFFSSFVVHQFKIYDDIGCVIGSPAVPNDYFKDNL